MPLDKPPEWYAGADARREADVIVSFQTPAGGWGKNQDFTAGPRLKGQIWVAAELPIAASTEGADEWHYVGTIDNDATYLQLEFLAKVIAAAKPDESAAWRASFLKGVDYILAAEFPGGGWPQIWPLAGGYHDALTYNDNAFVNVASLLTEVASGGLVPMEMRLKAAAAVKRSEAVLLATQVVVNGKRTVWAQQYDATTLKPVAARNFEPAALSSTESADLLLFLMSDPEPSPAVVAAVHDGIAFLNAVAIKDKAWKKGTMSDAPGALLWARFYDPVTFKPVFGDRDMTIHDSVNDLSDERREGYSWYNAGAAKALKKYRGWAAKHPLP
jgi:PelA/Pel-15E family pectate lyase